MKDVTFLEGLKVRLGYGVVGNQEIPNYLYKTVAKGSGGEKNNSNNAYPFGNDASISPGNAYVSLGTKDIHWEEQKTTNVGIDLTCWDGKIEFIGDYYKKVTDGMLIAPSIPGDAGLQYPPMINGGSIENSGLELMVTYKAKFDELRLNFGLNFATDQNKVTSLGAISKIIDGGFRNLGYVTQTEVGHPIGEFYGYKTNGLFQTQEEINNFKDKTGKLVQPKAHPGDVRYVDDDGDGKRDQYYMGSPWPKFTGGANLGVEFKGFDLSGMLTVVFGNKIYNGARWYTDNNTGFYNFDKRMLDAWNGAGSTNDVMYPRINYATSSNGDISDRFVEDGSYARLKTFQFGYTLSDDIAKALFLKKCRIYVGAENLLTFTKYTGLDPEIGIWGDVQAVTNTNLSLGIDRGTYPQPRTFLVGLNLTL
jgi:hypothetical protein